MDVEKTSIFFPNVDFRKFIMLKNEYGDLIGVKDDAPNDFKKAFEYCENSASYGNRKAKVGKNAYRY